ncbi:MAG: ribose-5-phosphate isomerase RpiA [Rhodothermales bacterium]|nr:ribose-5-phosphate isomerase RpiA [Rhodothermales bacterium]
MKQAVGRRVAAMVETGMVLGIGTGSTAAYAVEEIGRRVRGGSLEVRGVATSFAAERLARKYRIPLVTLADVPELDIAFDGADEVDPDLNLIKGRGAAHTREKIVARAAGRFVVLVDASKRVEVLGTRMPLPVEVLPMAAAPVTKSLEELGATVVLREGINKDGPIVTDQGLWVLDARFDAIDDPEGLDRQINDIPGVLDHGLFVRMATDVLVGLSPERIDHLTPS